MEYNKKYFLGANSCEGFVSHFEDSYKAEEGFNVYIIKGGPGTGKSSLLKRIAAKALEKDFAVELCPCSSDPDSLDSIIIPALKSVLLDGTAPHIVEPKYPGVCEEIVNLGELWDAEKLKGNREKIMLTTAQNKLLHKRASAYLSALGAIIRDNIALQRSATDIKKTVAYAEALSKKLLKKKGYYGGEEVRFLSGITPKGIVSYPKTVTEHYKNILVIRDKIGGVSSIICDTFRKNALNCGYDILTLKSSFLPSSICEHILVPELSLALVTENCFISFDCDARRIHSRRFTDSATLLGFKNRMSFNKKLGTELLKSATKTLADAKISHDILEEFYINAMDFSTIETVLKKLEEKIFINC